jgi:membrane fusion protein, adhesin transport system
MEVMERKATRVYTSPAAPANPEFESLSMVQSPRHGRIIAVLLMTMLTVIVLGLIFTPWVQNVSGTGRLIAFAPMERQQTIDAPIDGRILRWLVVEGSKVKEGDVIAEMSDNDAQIMTRLESERDAVQARLQAAIGREQSLGDRIIGVEGSRRNALSAAESRLSMAIDRVRAAEQLVDAGEATLRTASINIERQKRLLDRGLASNRTVELAELDHVRAITELDRAKAALNAARNEKLALEADKQKVETDFRSSIDDARASQQSARAEIANARAELQRMEVRVARQTLQTVRAPREGTIFRLIEQPSGNQMKVGEPIAILIPEASTPVVELWMKGNDIPLINVGRKVRLQFEGWPALQFAGWPSVAVGTFGGEVILVDQADDGKGRFRILVAPDEDDEAWPNRQYLRQGVRANGWVLLNEVKVWFELWRQFNGFPPVIAEGDPSVPVSGGKK